MRTRIFCEGMGRKRGSILLVCFFVLIMLSMFTMTVGYAMRQKLHVFSQLDARQKLRLIGDAGVQKSIYVLLRYREHPSVFDSLTQSWSRNEFEFKDIGMGDGSYSVFWESEAASRKGRSSEKIRCYGLVDEERKINLNLLRSPEILKRLFKETAGIGEDEAAALADSIKDWIDKDDDTSRGAESRYYKNLTPAYAARNGNLATLDELLWVKGMSQELFDKICPYVTLDSSGLVNLNTASEPVLLALGLSGPVAEKIILYRNGHDGVSGTEDDQVFDDLSSVPQILANEGFLNDNDRSTLGAVIQTGVLTVKSKHFSGQVLAKLKYKTESLRVFAVFDDQGVVKRWEESFVVS